MGCTPPHASTPLQVIKDLRQQEVEERPELGQVVLEGRAGQQQLVVGGQPLQLPHQPTVEVLDPVAFVHNEILPLEALEDGTAHVRAVTHKYNRNKGH